MIDDLAVKLSGKTDSFEVSEEIVPPMIAALDVLFCNDIGSVGFAKIDGAKGRYKYAQIYGMLSKRKEATYKEEIKTLKKR